MNISRMKFY